MPNHPVPNHPVPNHRSSRRWRRRRLHLHLHRDLRCPPRPRRCRRGPASRNGSAPAGWSGSAASRSRSAASSWCAIRSSRAGSGRACGSRSARSWRRRWSAAASGCAAASRVRMRRFRREHSEHSHRRRHHGGVRDRVGSLRALRISRAGRGLPDARHRGARRARRRHAARACARSARPRRRRGHAAPRRIRKAGLLGALHLSRDRHRCRVRARPPADVAMARGRGHRLRPVLGAPGYRGRPAPWRRISSTRSQALFLPRS